MNISNKKKLKFFKVLFPAYIRILRRPTPTWVHLFITRKCNLDCDYCFQKDNTKSDLSNMEIKRIIDKLYSHGTRILSFLGGEPTIRKDFVDLVKYANKK